MAALRLVIFICLIVSTLPMPVEEKKTTNKPKLGKEDQHEVFADPDVSEESREDHQAEPHRRNLTEQRTSPAQEKNHETEPQDRVPSGIDDLASDQHPEIHRRGREEDQFPEARGELDSASKPGAASDEQQPLENGKNEGQDGSTPLPNITSPTGKGDVSQDRQEKALEEQESANEIPQSEHAEQPSDQIPQPEPAVDQVPETEQEVLSVDQAPQKPLEPEIPLTEREQQTTEEAPSVDQPEQKVEPVIPSENQTTQPEPPAPSVDQIPKKPEEIPVEKAPEPERVPVFHPTIEDGSDDDDPAFIAIIGRPLPILTFSRPEPTVRFYGPPRPGMMPLIHPNPLLRDFSEGLGLIDDTSDSSSEEDIPRLFQAFLTSDLEHAPSSLAEEKWSANRDTNEQDSSEKKVKDGGPELEQEYEGDVVKQESPVDVDYPDSDVASGKAPEKDPEQQETNPDTTDVVALIEDTVLTIASLEPIGQEQDSQTSQGPFPGLQIPVILVPVVPTEGVLNATAGNSGDGDGAVTTEEAETSTQDLAMVENDQNKGQGSEVSQPEHPFRQIKPFESEVDFDFGDDLAHMHMVFPTGKGIYEVQDGKGNCRVAEFFVDGQGNFQLVNSNETMSEGNIRKFSFTSGGVKVEFQLKPRQ